MRVRDVAFAVVLNVLAVDENDGVRTFADSEDALSKTSKFLCVRFAPQFLVLGVHKEVPHLHEVARGFVKDSVEHVRGELPECCVVSRDRVARCFTIIVDTGQHGFLSYRLDLGLTAGVACRTNHRVYLVVQDA